MMQESGSEATSNGSASQNGASSGKPFTDCNLREVRSNGETPSLEVSAADLVHLQQHQVHHLPHLRYSLITVEQITFSICLIQNHICTGPLHLKSCTFASNFSVVFS